MARARPAVFSIPPGADFAGTLVRALLDRRLIDLPFAEDPGLLADLVIYVPTRRARPVIEAAFAAAFAPRPILLPAIRPLAEPGDPLADIVETALDPIADHPSVSPEARRFRLLPLVEAWHRGMRRVAGDEARDAGLALRDALMLAGELGRLIDEMRIAGLPLETLASVAPPGYDPARFDAYWSHSRDFLRIAAEFWPATLAETGARDAIDLRLAAIEDEALRLQRDDPKTPMLVVGSTGSVAATARLMRQVARLDFGAVVLPGLDTGLAEGAWALIGDDHASIGTRFAHAQASLKRSLAEIGVGRGDVAVLAEAHPRMRLISEALRPAETVDAWRASAATIDLDAALAGLAIIEAPDEREEALAVAILMRRTLEKPGARVAFVTADRALAERVRSELRRFGIDATDTAGTPLAECPAGLLARLFLKAARMRDGISILSLLNHPDLRLGWDASTARALAQALELLVFRGRHFAAPMRLADRVRHALGAGAREHRAAAAIPEAIRAGLHDLAAMLDDAFEPFREGEASLAGLAETLAATLLTFTRDASGAALIEADPDGPDLLDFLAEIAAQGGSRPIAAPAFGPAIDLLLSERIMPPARRDPGRAAILGPLEARLVFADRIILGGLNEGSFPPVATEDPFLNRAMRLDLGLQPPEWRIGQSAHDFMMLACNPEIVLTRAGRVEGEPRISSRFLRRIEAFVGAGRWKALRDAGEAVLGWGRMLDAPGPYAPIAPPAPVPARPRVPARLSITEIETLHRDPYAIYARHILGLERFEAIDPELDARERGTVLHKALELYAAGEPPLDPEEAAQRLRDIGAECFRPIAHDAELHAFWWQRFLAIIPGFVGFDRARRAAGSRVLAEQRGRATLALAGGDLVTLSGKADRIERTPDGTISVFDYKSGEPPARIDIAAGFAPQLPITAALIAEGAFAGIAPGARIDELAYLAIGGSKPVEQRSIQGNALDAEGLASRDMERLMATLERLAEGLEGYPPRIRPARGDVEGDYDHLARIAEWSSTSGASDDPGDGDSPSYPEDGP